MKHLTQVDRLIKSLRESPKSKAEIETLINFRAEVKDIVYEARKKGYSVTYDRGKYILNED